MPKDMSMAQAADERIRLAEQLRILKAKPNPSAIERVTISDLEAQLGVAPESPMPEGSDGNEAALEGMMGREIESLGGGEELSKLLAIKAPTSQELARIAKLSGTSTDDESAPSPAAEARNPNEAIEGEDPLTPAVNGPPLTKGMPPIPAPYDSNEDIQKLLDRDQGSEAPRYGPPEDFPKHKSPATPLADSLTSARGSIRDAVQALAPAAVPEARMESLFKTAMGTKFDPNSPMDRKKRAALERMIAQDPSVLDKSDTKIALHFYRQQQNR